MKILLPNIRKLFVPDPGYVIFDADLRGADGQVVAWEAGDAELKMWLRTNVDMHERHAVEIGGEDPANITRRVRQAYKHATHGIHYGASPRAIARHPGVDWPIHKAEDYRRRYFARRPGVLEWHKRVEDELRRFRRASNKLGRRIYYFDRIEGLLPQALAWIPQSTVALVCFKGALQLSKLHYVEILLQVHDSLVFQVPYKYAENYEEILRHLEVEVPYPNDPLVIPWGLSKSEKSWGDVEKVR